MAFFGLDGFLLQTTPPSVGPLPIEGEGTLRNRLTAFLSNQYNDRIMLPTYRPNRRRRAKKVGFRKRMHTTGGRAVLSRRRRKGRHALIPK